MTGVIDIFTETEGAGNADVDLLVYAMTFVNKILYAITGIPLFSLICLFHFNLQFNLLHFAEPP